MCMAKSTPEMFISVVCLGQRPFLNSALQDVRLNVSVVWEKWGRICAVEVELVNFVGYAFECVENNLC